MKINICRIVFLLIIINVNAQISLIGGKTIKGNGVMASNDYHISNFDNLKVKGNLEVVMVEFATKIIVEGEENLLKYIKIKKLRDGTLYISSPIKYKLTPSIGQKIKVIVPISNIKSLALSGSGTFTSKTLIKVNKLELKISGSGKLFLNINTKLLHSKISGTGQLNIEGIAEISRFKIRGSGKISAINLMINHIYIKMSGSGIVRINKIENIDIIKRGDGKLLYN